MKKLSPLDYSFIALETPESPLHITAVQIFEIPKGYRGNFVADLVKQLLERREVAAPFNYKLRPALVGLPSWEELDYVDLEYHIRHNALPKPGTLHELWHLISRLTARLLDRSRPLWEMHIIEGLEGNRFAIYTKMHHAFIDGATGVRLMRGAMSDSPDDRGGACAMGASGNEAAASAAWRARQPAGAVNQDRPVDAESVENRAGTDRTAYAPRPATVRGSPWTSSHAVHRAAFAFQCPGQRGTAQRRGFATAVADESRG